MNQKPDLAPGETPAPKPSSAAQAGSLRDAILDLRSSITDDGARQKLWDAASKAEAAHRVLKSLEKKSLQ